MPHLIIVGAGGLGLEVAAYARDISASGSPSFTVKGFLDDTKPKGTLHAGFPVLGSTDAPLDSTALYIIALGKPDHRRTQAQKLSAIGANFATLLHPAAYIADSAEIAEGTIAAPFTFIGPEAKVGRHCLVNIYASVGHEAKVGDFCTFSPYATANGCVTMGNDVFLGTKAALTPAVIVGDGAQVAAGSVVYNTVEPQALVIGNPAAHRKAKGKG